MGTWGRKGASTQESGCKPLTNWEARALQLKALGALAEDLGSGPSTPTAAHR